MPGPRDRKKGGKKHDADAATPTHQHEPGPEGGSYDLPDEFGERIGETSSQEKNR
jgi:hypothetical protein